MQKLKKTSICPIDIPIHIIKAFPDKLSTPLVSIFNDISNSGCYPSRWKVDYITPIKKKRGVNDFTGVRQITLTPVFFSKIQSPLGNKPKKKEKEERNFSSCKKYKIPHFCRWELETSTIGFSNMLNLTVIL